MSSKTLNIPKTLNTQTRVDKNRGGLFVSVVCAFSSHILSLLYLERERLPDERRRLYHIAKEGHAIIIIIIIMSSSRLFSVCNAFHLGAYQVAINEASELNTELSAAEQVEKDCYAYRSYVALGSYQVYASSNRAFFCFSLSLSLFGFLSLFCVCCERRVDRSSGVDDETTTTTTKKKKKKKKKRFDGALKSPEKLK